MFTFSHTLQYRESRLVVVQKINFEFQVKIYILGFPDLKRGVLYQMSHRYVCQRQCLNHRTDFDKFTPNMYFGSTYGHKKLFVSKINHGVLATISNFPEKVPKYVLYEIHIWLKIKIFPNLQLYTCSVQTKTLFITYMMYCMSCYTSPLVPTNHCLTIF